jgi:hypothetical protein
MKTVIVNDCAKVVEFIYQTNCVYLDKDEKYNNQHECTAFMITAKLGYYDITRLLKDEIGIVYGGNAAIMYAASNRHAKIVEMLMDELYFVDNSVQNPLMAAAQEGFWK